MDAFEDQFDTLYGRAYGVAYVVLGRRAEAEDVAQETLARAYVRWRKVHGYAEPWVVRVAGNLAIDRVRRIGHVGTMPARDDAGPDAARVDLQRALASLPRRQREVVVLRYLADLPEREVAAMLGCSPGTVKTHAFAGAGEPAPRTGDRMSDFDFDLDALRDPDPPAPRAAARAAVRERAARLRRRAYTGRGAVAFVVALAVALAGIAAAGRDGGREAIVTAQSVAGTTTSVPAGARLDPVLAPCFPPLAPVSTPATAATVTGVPASEPRLLILSTDGTIRVLDGTHLTTWSSSRPYRWRASPTTARSMRAG